MTNEAEPRTSYMKTKPHRYLKQAIQDAQLLVAYAAQSGLPMDESTLNTLVNAQFAFDQENWTSKEEAGFWQAFNDINRAIAPVTVESLKTVSLVENTDSWFHWPGILKRANRTVYFYIAFAFLTMVLLLATQVYWLIGTRLLHNIGALNHQAQELARSGFTKEKYRKAYQALELKIETNRATLELWNAGWESIPYIPHNTVEENAFRKGDYETDIRELREQLKDATAKLGNAKKFTFGDSEFFATELAELYQKRVDALTEQLIEKKTAYNRNKSEYRRGETELRDQYVLQVLQSYLLPLLYGLLGAAAYVLRSLIRDIRDATYNPQMDIQYGVKMFLGASAGPMIGYFIAPQGTSGLGSLSPMALSFVAGYNIDVLFIAMDRIISSISKKASGTENPVPDLVQKKVSPP
ncbi:MAG: hypothetical protein GY862_02035 [Gammaproteobacteria bacterium]|nr:hypothetical protein [Gammaproteobacteria bacterium]